MGRSGGKPYNPDMISSTSLRGLRREEEGEFVQLLRVIFFN